MSVRLGIALSEGGLVLPEAGRIAVFHPRADQDLSDLPKELVQIIQPFYPDFVAFQATGYACVQVPDESRFSASLVCLPRAKALAKALIATALDLTDGPVVIDGVKTDGIDSLYKDLRKRINVSGPISKAHGKLFWMSGGSEQIADWKQGNLQNAGEFVTAPGIFSADSIDPASQLLAESLPEYLGKHIADLGAGWGYLAARLLPMDGVKSLDLIEADYIALTCARSNVTDPRARFHWDDALHWVPENRIDTVVMNPPFHSGRTSDPEIGRNFIRAAARMLTPSGNLWMVANRHLAYETTLNECFAHVEERPGDNKFKILHASRPSRAAR